MSQVKNVRSNLVSVNCHLVQVGISTTSISKRWRQRIVRSMDRIPRSGLPPRSVHPSASRIDSVDVRVHAVALAQYT